MVLVCDVFAFLHHTYLKVDGQLDNNRMWAVSKISEPTLVNVDMSRTHTSVPHRRRQLSLVTGRLVCALTIVA